MFDLDINKYFFIIVKDFKNSTKITITITF